jgi:hypothetical protein
MQDAKFLMEFEKIVNKTGEITMNDIELKPSEILKDLHIVEFLQREAKFYLAHAQDEERGMKALQPYHRFSASKSYPKAGRGE